MAPGQALSDFNIFRLIARYWGCDSMFRDWTSPESVFQILKRCSAGQPCDITGIEDYAMIDARGGIQWPFTPEHAAATPNRVDPHAVPDHSASERRLFEDGRFHHADGRAKFLFESPRPAPELTDNEHPFELLTGRGTSAQWHTQTRTGCSAVLRQLHPESLYVEMNPEDARRLGVEGNDEVRVTSRRGSVTATAFVTPTVKAGQVFLPMHYETANQLTYPAFDRYSRQPSYKHCAVKIVKVV